eukprot:scaffold26695_cov71-Cyclotella_meneghiniana.AAC.15
MRDAHVVATHRTIPDADTPSSLPRYEMRYLLLLICVCTGCGWIRIKNDEYELDNWILSL